MQMVKHKDKEIIKNKQKGERETRLKMDIEATKQSSI